MGERVLVDVELRDDVEISDVIDELEQYTDGSEDSLNTVIFPKHQTEADLDTLLNIDPEEIN